MLEVDVRADVSAIFRLVEYHVLIDSVVVVVIHPAQHALLSVLGYRLRPPSIPEHQDLNVSQTP